MLVRHSATYLLGNVSSALFGLLSVVVFTRLVPKQDYGYYVIGLTTAAILNALLFHWIKLSYSRLQSEGSHVDLRPAAVVTFAGSALVLVLASPLFLLVMPHGLALGCVALTLSLAALELTQESMRAGLAASSVAKSTLVRASAAFVLGSTAAIAGLGGVGLIFSASLAAIAATLCFSLYWRIDRASVDREDLRSLALLGAPLAISSAVFALASGLDRLVVGYLLGFSASGEYGASADLVRQIIMPAGMSIAAAVVPLAVRTFTNGGPEAGRQHLNRSAELLAGAAAPAAIGLVIVSPFVSSILLGPDYQSSARMLIPILAFAAFFAVISHGYIHVSFLVAKKPSLVAVHGGLMLAVNAALLAMLTPHYHLVGAAFAVLATEVCGVIVGFVLARWAVPLPFAAGRLARIAVATAVMALLTLALREFFEPTDFAGLITLVLAGAMTYAAVAIALDILGVRAWIAARLRRNRVEACSAAPT